ncbi:hypothetical protein PoB_006623100 [Plakobranchus ocellatus]|uniref:Uncharacterized protein n=1 Tax=Plakobranchus ocellatus TaxID=259542 RepID=A0AAV4D6P7_9GAST|nr:hypothetical protein PoB_006623100 [Plakobranchus ocellatus]
MSRTFEKKFTNRFYRGTYGRSGGPSGGADGYNVRGPSFESQSGLIAPCCPPSTNGLLGLLKLSDSKGGEESSGKLPQNAVCQEQSES